jgi:hypothetical protein
LPFGDGILTGRGTFQKFFGRAEAIPASLGICYVFKDETL